MHEATFNDNKKNHRAMDNKKVIINIGRQLGSGGREIGKMLAEKFKAGYYDKELLTLAAKSSGLCEEFFRNADEKATQGLSAMFSMRIPFVTEASIAGCNYLSNDSLFKIQSDVIRELAAQGSCVFVGRCSDYVLREDPACVNVFISAPRRYRAERIAAFHGCSLEKAEDMIERTDKKRAEFYNYYSYKTWGKASTYHLCIDSSVLGTEGTCQFIEEFVKRKLSL